MIAPMQLDVLQPDSAAAWYADGLKFTCTQCGNCCTGPAGFVWISEVEISRLAGHLQLSVEEVVERYCRTVAGRLSLKERRTPEGNYDCIFLKEQPADPSSGTAPPNRRKTCSIYAFRPLQCRTWPFWPENLSSKRSWKISGKRCHGMGRGNRHFTFKQIQALRDATDWPMNPPTSLKVKKKAEGSGQNADGKVDETLA